jgi:hypothetical protein
VAQRGTTLFEVLTHDVNLCKPDSSTLPNCFIRGCPLLSRRMLLFLRLLKCAYKRLKPHSICNSGKQVNQNCRKFWRSSLFYNSSFPYLAKIVRWQKFHQEICRVKKRGKKEYKERGMLLYSHLTHQPNTTPITNTVDTRFTSILTQTIAPSIIPLTTFNIYSALQDMIDSFIWRFVQHLLRTTDLLWKIYKGNNRGSTPSSHQPIQFWYWDGGLFPWTGMYK